MIYTTNARGFVVIEFQDRYGVKCSLQQSSLATEDAIWFGPSEPNPKILHGDAKRLGIVTDADCGWVPYPLPEEVQCTTRMHLTRQQVAKLLPILERFASTGELS
jgi:hypothetical protein